MFEKNKFIFLSKLFFFTNDNKLIKEKLSIVDLFYDQEVVLLIVAREATARELRPLIPEEYREKICVIGRGKNYKEIVKEYKAKGAIFGMIGIVEEDAIFSFNCKIPLFNPEQLIGPEVAISNKVKNYGLPIIKFENIINCLKSYEIHKDNYFQIDFNEQYSVRSLNNANTHHKPTEEEDIKTIFATNLKADESTRNQRILLLLLFHLMNEITTNKDFEEVDFWGTFPSSDPENTDTAISFIKEAVRKIVNGKPTSGPEILIRKSPMNSKHSSRIQLRLTNKSNKDFETLIINPQLINEIKGKVICIIDDYITNGYSAEAAKHLLLNAGARKVIFISMGKFGGKYYSTDYDIDGDLSGSYSYKFCKETCWDGKGSYNPNSDVYILNFKDIIN